MQQLCCNTLGCTDLKMTINNVILLSFPFPLFFSHTYRTMILTPTPLQKEKLADEPLLPENIANMVTAISLATRISLRCSSLFFDAIFEAAKYGTSLSLGLSRNALTSAIITAKNIHNNDHLVCSSQEQEER